MNTKHTPGPWQWLDDYRQLVGTGKDSDVLARSEAGDLYVPHWETGYANARLIAAAPDLLAAAQAAWNCIGELSPTQARVETAQLLQSAIEKANGGEA